MPVKTQEEHRAGFADFVALETVAAGPSPNLRLIEVAARNLPQDRTSQAWFAACYCAIYNTPGALALWHGIEPEEALHNQDEVEKWAVKNKSGLPVHSNRLRTHGSMKKLAAGLNELAKFVLADEWEKADDYDRLWSQVNDVPAVGRYFGIKFAGALQRLHLTEAKQYDIRAKGAKNGRKTLGLIFGDCPGTDPKQGGKEAVVEAEHLASQLHADTWTSYGLKSSWFQFEALLCEYNQMVKGDRYPGKTSDSDLDALDKVEAHWGHGHQACIDTWDARAEALPPFAYELRKRKPLLDVYEKHGYAWSDALYDWSRTEDLAHPYPQRGGICDWQPLLKPGAGPL